MLLLTTALAAPALQQVQTSIDGRNRPALVFKPKGVDKPPVVLAFHGIGGKAQGLAEQWARVAEKEGLMVVVPVIPAVQGWFDGPKKNHETYDHDLFTSWRDYAVAQGGDAERVFLTGYSMGGHFAASVYCSGAPVAGVGVIGMSMTVGQEKACARDTPAPFVYVANKQDKLATAGSRKVAGFNVTFVSQEKTLDRVRQINGCGELKVEKRGNADFARAECTGAPLVARRAATASHSRNANGFDAVAFLWKQLDPR